MTEQKKSSIPKPDASVPVPPKRLERLPKSGKIAGVCAGLADYLYIDVTLVRVMFVVLTLASGGFGIIVYFILALIMPVASNQHKSQLQVATLGENVNHLVDEVRDNGAINKVRNYLGVSLMLFGFWLLLLQFFPDWIKFDWNFVWPAALVVIGIVLLTQSKK